MRDGRREAIEFGLAERPPGPLGNLLSRQHIPSKDLVEQGLLREDRVFFALPLTFFIAKICIPLGWMWWQEKRTIAALPVVTVDDTEHAGEYRRVEGSVASDAVYWAPRGTGRGRNNYSGAGVLVNLPSGIGALLVGEIAVGAGFRRGDERRDERRTDGSGQGDRLHHRGPAGVLRLRRRRLPRPVIRRSGAVAVVSVS